MYYYKLSDYLKNEYGEKLYKLLLSSGMTCPNRDGKCGKNGCIFCSEKGSGEFSENSNVPIDLQIENAKKHVPTVSGQYIAYFQSFSNTYAKAEDIWNLYYPVVIRDDIAILSIATRPDCLPDDVIEVLGKLNKIKPIWIELGLQTINDKTAQYIRRGYPLQIYSDAVNKLKSINVKVITHLILGLPFETKNDMINSTKFAGKVSDGIKFHMLYITNNSQLGKQYKSSSFVLLSKEEYIDILCKCIRVIPENVVIHRLTGDCEESKLIAPLWTKDKVRLLREIENAFYDRNIIQGENADT